jgi:ribulose-bisphosphate carboxylase large chain
VTPDSTQAVEQADQSLRFSASYLIETAVPLDDAAASMAGEQSTGTFLKLESEDDPVVQRQAARVETLVEVGDTTEPSLPNATAVKFGKSYRRAEVTLSWPMESIGPSLQNLMATVAGNLFELKQLSGIRLKSISLPSTFVAAHPGPAFGIDGTRRLAGVERLPLIGTIIKPSIGLTPEATAASVKRLVDAGIDFIKDDELQSDGAFCPFEARVDAVMRVINEAADRTGRKPMFAFNLSGDIDEMRRRHDAVLKAGGTCVMASLLWVGLSGFAVLRRHSELPIHGHRNGWGLFYRAPMLGMDYQPFQTIWRLAGADHMHVNGLRNKFAEPGESSIASARTILAPLDPHHPMRAMPVFSSGQWAGQAVDTYQALGSADVIYACGGGIVGHPQGTAAGVASVREAWEAAMAGETLADRAERSAALAAALAFFK